MQDLEGEITTLREETGTVASQTKLRAIFMREIAAGGSKEAAFDRVRSFATSSPDIRDVDLVPAR